MMTYKSLFRVGSSKSYQRACFRYDIKPFNPYHCAQNLSFAGFLGTENFLCPTADKIIEYKITNTCSTNKRAMVALVRSPEYHMNQEYSSYLTLA